MPDYKALNRYRDMPPGNDPDKARHVAERLLTLRHDLYRDIGAERDPRGLIVASWNIRAFDDGAPRLDESFHYLAEIISNFDICAIQEVKADLTGLRRLVRLLGPNWDYFVSDTSQHRGGNDERGAFVYNRNKVFFRKVIGEIVLPDGLLQGNSQPARSPFFATFQAGWFRFTLCSVHIIEGRDGHTAAQNRALRAAEITAIGAELARRAAREDEVFFLVGDMNIEKDGDEIMAALRNTSLEVPDFGNTNLSGSKKFDHIAFTVQGAAERKTRLLRHGVFDWRNAVFGPSQPTRSEAPPDAATALRVSDADNIGRYETILQDHRRAHGRAAYTRFRELYQSKTTYEMSDHLPIWVEVETDYSDDYLASFLPGGHRAARTG